MAARTLEVRVGSGAQGSCAALGGLDGTVRRCRMLEEVLLAQMHEKGQLPSDGGYYPCSIASFSSRCRATDSLSMVIYDITCSVETPGSTVGLICASSRFS
jgi:hypothetical protein